jgi:hypothetical protein
VWPGPPELRRNIWICWNCVGVTYNGAGAPAAGTRSIPGIGFSANGINGCWEAAGGNGVYSGADRMTGAARTVEFTGRPVTVPILGGAPAFEADRGWAPFPPTGMDDGKVGTAV